MDRVTIEDRQVNLTIKGKEHNLKLPVYYMVKDNKICTFLKKGDGNTIEAILSPILLFPFEVVNNIDTGEEKISIALYKYGKWKVGTFPKSTLYSRNKLIELADFGIPVTTDNVDSFINYLWQFEMVNFINAEPIKAVNKMGWQENYTKFVPFSDDIIIDSNYQMQRWINGYSVSGNLEDWLKEIKDFRNNNLFRFILATSFAAPLVRILGNRIFVVYNYGDSRAGKTAMLYVALSIWGNPQDLICTFNATTVGIERIASFYNDLILAIDEREIEKSQKELEKTIFTLSSGMGRLRGNKLGGIQEMNTFNTIILATGEQPITTEESTTGVATRILELEGSPFSYNEKLSSRMYEVTSKYYGNAGRKFIDIIIQKYNYEKLKGMYENLKKKLEESTTNNIQTYINAVALVVLADIIVSKDIFNEESEETSIKMGLNILEQLSTSQEINVVDKAYEQVSSWILANYKSFDTYREENIDGDDANDVESNSYGTSYGLYDEGVYYVHRYILDNWFKKHNYSTRKIIDGFIKRGYITIKRDEKGKIKDKAIQKKFRGVNCRMYAFPMKNVPEIIETYFYSEKRPEKMTLIKNENEKFKMGKSKGLKHPNIAKYGY